MTGAASFTGAALLAHPSVLDALRSTRATLAAAGIPDASLEAEVLLMHAAALSRERLLVALRDPWPAAAAPRLHATLRRRLQREPLAYITGTKEFFGLDIAVDSRVLIPRQETETLVELALDIARREWPDRPVRIADIGTGSGAIAIAIAAHLPNAIVSATDASADALAVASANAQRHGLADRIAFLHGDLLAPVSGSLDLLLANLPYIPDAQWPALQPEIRLHEPQHALLGGTTGLELVERLLRQLLHRRHSPSSAILELGHGQVPQATDCISKLFPQAAVTPYRDLAGLERGVIIGGIPSSSA